MSKSNIKCGECGSHKLEIYNDTKVCDDIGFCLEHDSDCIWADYECKSCGNSGVLYFEFSEDLSN